MKRVFLYAYDKQNLGDDLFVYTITKRYPDVRFYMWSDKVNQIIFQSLHNLKVVDRDIFGWGNTGKIQVSALSEKLPELYHNRLLQQM